MEHLILGQASGLEMGLLEDRLRPVRIVGTNAVALWAMHHEAVIGDLFVTVLLPVVLCCHLNQSVALAALPLVDASEHGMMHQVLDSLLGILEIFHQAGDWQKAIFVDVDHVDLATLESFVDVHHVDPATLEALGDESAATFILVMGKGSDSGIVELRHNSGFQIRQQKQNYDSEMSNKVLVNLRCTNFEFI